MQEIKYYCDICKREMKALPFSTNVGLYGTRYLKEKDDGFDKIDIEICYSCVRKISYYIENGCKNG